MAARQFLTAFLPAQERTELARAMERDFAAALGHGNRSLHTDGIYQSPLACPIIAHQHGATSWP